MVTCSTRPRTLAIAVTMAIGMTLARPAPARAPQAPADPAAETVTLVFRVVDRAGAPIVDLAAADVTVKVGGRLRAIRSFDLVRFDRPEDALGQPPKGLPPPFMTNRPDSPVRDLLLVLEDDSIASGNEEMVRNGVEHLLSSLSPHDAAVGHAELYEAPPGARVEAKVELAAFPEGPALASMPARAQPAGADGPVSVSFVLPLGGIPPGDYWVRVVILVDGAEVARPGRTLRKRAR